MPTYGTNVPCLRAHLCSLRRKYTEPTSTDQGFRYGYKHKKKYFYNTLFSIFFGSIHII